MKSPGDKQIIVAYVPVLHEGYRRFFEKYPEAESLFLIGPEITREFKALTKDIRALDTDLMRKSLLAWKRFDNIEVIGLRKLQDLAATRSQIIMPDEEVMQELKAKYFAKSTVVFDSIFLRWDKHRSSENQPVQVDQIISADQKDQKLMIQLKKEAQKSSDIWRQIGAALVKNGKVLKIIYNRAVPSEHLPYEEGDPRSDFSKGINIELSTSFHCEARLIAEAARDGLKLEGASIYVTTFPCPVCAKLIAYSGIKEIYYTDGYGVLDGERILKSQGVKIIFVKIN